MELRETGIERHAVEIAGPSSGARADARLRGLGRALRPAQPARDRGRRRRLRPGGLGPGSAGRRAGRCWTTTSTRHVVRTLLRGRFEVPGHRPLWASGRLDAGVLRVTVPAAPCARPPQLRGSEERHDQAGSVYLDGEYRLPAVLRAALALAARLAAPRTWPGRLRRDLGERAGAAGAPTSTLLYAAAGVSRARGDASRRSRAARDDEDAEVRVRAGIALGTEGRDVLLGLAGGEGAEDATSARAVTALAASLTFEKASQLLKDALRTRRLETAKACLEPWSRSGSVAIATLAKVLLVERGELGEAAARGARRDGRSVGRGAARPRARRGTDGAAPRGRGRRSAAWARATPSCPCARPRRGSRRCAARLGRLSPRSTRASRAQRRGSCRSPAQSRASSRSPRTSRVA